MDSVKIMPRDWQCFCGIYAISGSENTIAGFFEVLGFWLRARVLEWHRCAKS